MNPLFVYPDYALHTPWRQLTSRYNMVVSNRVVFHNPQQVPRKIAFADFEKSWYPRWATAQEARNSFLQTGSVDLTQVTPYSQGIRPVGLRLSKKFEGYNNTALAYELLTWGVGTLRPVKTFEDSGLVRALACLDADNTRPHPKISSASMQVSGYIMYHDDQIEENNPCHMVRRELYESTNLIFADVYGELEQLVRRRNEHSFLEKYLRDLRSAMRFRRQDHTRDNYSSLSYAPSVLHSVCEPIARVLLEHIKFGQWDSSPKDIAELLDRVTFILDNTFIDPAPFEEYCTEVRLAFF